MVARAADGTVVAYPTVETIQEDSICTVVVAPAQIDGKVAEAAQALARQAIASLEGPGVFGVEMFLLESGAALAAGACAWAGTGRRLTLPRPCGVPGPTPIRQARYTSTRSRRACTTRATTPWTRASARSLSSTCASLRACRSAPPA